MTAGLIPVTPLWIANRQIGGGAPCYFIAEIGSNHNQDLGRACEMIEIAAEAGADAVKFQSLRFEELYSGAAASDEMRVLFQQIELREDWYPILAERTRQAGVHFLSSPTYLRSIDCLLDVGVPAFKIASPQTYGFLHLLRRAAETGVPLVVSTGYCGLREIDRAVATMREVSNAAFALLHCTSRYPVEADAVNLRAMETLSKRYGVPVGFSDHTLGAHVPLAAVARGAAILEKHFTLDRSLPGPDHHFAIEPAELAVLIHQIREVEAALGTGSRDEVPPDEVVRRPALQMHLVAARELQVGEKLGQDDIDFRRTGEGLPEQDWNRIVGRVVRRPLCTGEPIRTESLDGI